MVDINNTEDSNVENNNVSNDAENNIIKDNITRENDAPDRLNAVVDDKKNNYSKKSYIKSYINKEHIYKNRGFYAFRYVAMLLSGVGFLSCLISILSITVSKLVNGDKFSASSWYGPLYANLIAAVIILGIAHLLLSLTVDKKWRAEDGEKRKYPVVLSVIYSVGLGISAICFLIFFMGTLIGSALGLIDVTGTEILEQFLNSSLAILILSFALIYKLDLLRSVTKFVYAIVLGSTALISTILFLAFPANEIRNTIHDDNVVKDLYTIEDKIEEYSDERSGLPRNLDELVFEKNELKYSLKNYEYTVSNNNRSRYGRSYYSEDYIYEICAEFKTNTEDDEDYYYSSYKYSSSDSYYRHPAGKKCFTRTVYGGYIDDDEYYYKNEDTSDNYDWLNRQFLTE